MPRKNAPTERMCLVSRETKPVSEMIRFVLSPDNDVVPDLKNTLPGRGVWVTADATNVDFAVEKRLFARGFKQSANVAPELVAQIDALLEASLVKALGMAQKAGQITTGFTKVVAALQSQDVLALLAASDASDDGKRKIRGKLYSLELIDEVEVIGCLTSDQMSNALGRLNVNHAALSNGGAASAAYDKAVFLARFRGEESGLTDKQTGAEVVSAGDGEREI